MRSVAMDSVESEARDCFQCRCHMDAPQSSWRLVGGNSVQAGNRRHGLLYTPVS